MLWKLCKPLDFLDVFMATAPAMSPLIHETGYINLTVASPRSRFPSKHMTGRIGMITLVPPLAEQSNLIYNMSGGDY